MKKPNQIKYLDDIQYQYLITQDLNDIDFFIRAVKEYLDFHQNTNDKLQLHANKKRKQYLKDLLKIREILLLNKVYE